MATPYQERKISPPQLNEGDAPYFEAATQGKLLVKYCNDCKQYHHYPRPLCPFCFSDKTEWREAKGTGTVYSFSITRVPGPIPYAIAYVTLDEGPSHPGGVPSQPDVRFEERAEDVRPHLPGQFTQELPRT